MPRMPSRMVFMPRHGGRAGGPDVDLLADDLIAEREADLAAQALRADAEAARRGKPGWLRRLIGRLPRAGRQRPG